MIPFNEIDECLKALGADRKWLAQVTGRSEGSIRAALAPKSVPKNRTLLLQIALSDAIEKEEAARAAASGTSTLNGVFNIAQNQEEAHLTDLASRAINARSIADFCPQAIRYRAHEIMFSNIAPSRPDCPIQK